MVDALKQELMVKPDSRRGSAASGQPIGWLRDQVGELLRRERLRAGLSQEAFARRAAASQQLVSRLERGVGSASTDTIERLFGALGHRVRLVLETSDAKLDRQILAVARDSGAERSIAADSLRFIWTWRAWPPRMVIDGALAALLHGLPIPVEAYDLVCAEDDLDLLADWIVCLPNIQRFDERLVDFDSRRIDPRQPGTPHWRTSMCQFRVRTAPELPEFALVKIEDTELPVRPLPQVAAEHEEVARVLARLAGMRET